MTETSKRPSPNRVSGQQNGLCLSHTNLEMILVFRFRYRRAQLRAGRGEIADVLYLDAARRGCWKKFLRVEQQVDP